LTPTVKLAWSLHGAFTQQTPVENPASVKLVVNLFPSPAGIYGSMVVQQVVGSSQGKMVNLSGTTDLSAAYQALTGKSLTAGDRFILDPMIELTSSNPTFISPIGTFTSDFLNTAAISLGVSDPRAGIQSAAALATLPLPSGLWLGLTGLVSLLFCRRRRPGLRGPIPGRPAIGLR